MTAFPPMHGDPLFSRPAEAWQPQDWDEFDHLNAMAVDEEALERAKAAAENPVRSTT